MKWKPLLFSHLAIILLLGSFLWPATRCGWEIVDRAVFKCLNGTLDGHPFAQIFWGLLNHKRVDLIEDAVFLLFFILGIYAAPKQDRLRRTGQFVFCILFAGCIIFFVNRTFLRNHVLIPRDSPSIVIQPHVRVTETLTRIKIKDKTAASFPGDHATTLLLFATLYTFFAGKKLGLYAYLYAAFRILPRLIVGAHWLSDILVGSVSLSLFFICWALCTPLHTWMIDRIERFLRLFKDEVKKEPV